MSKQKKNALGHDPFAALGGLDLWDDEPAEEPKNAAPAKAPSLGSLTNIEPAVPAKRGLAALLLEPEIAEPPVVEPQTAVSPPAEQQETIEQPTPPEPTAVSEPETVELAEDISETAEPAEPETVVVTPEPAAVTEPAEPVEAVGDVEETALDLPDWNLFSDMLEQPLEEADQPLDDALFAAEEADPFDDEMWLSLLQEAEETEEETPVDDDLLLVFDDMLAAEETELDVATSIALEDALGVPETADPIQAAPTPVVAEEPEPETADPLMALISRIDGEMVQTEGLAGKTETIFEPERSAEREVQHIIFELAEIQYAVPIHHVLEITKPQQITAVPNVPDWLMGVTNLRGDILSLVNFRRFLNMPPSQFHHENQMLVIEDPQSEIVTGLIVDKVLDMQRLIENQIGTVDVPIPPPVKPYTRGAYDVESAFLIVLNVNSLLNSTSMRQFETSV